MVIAKFIRQKLFLIFVVTAICLLLPAAWPAQTTTDENDPIKLFEQGQDAHEKGDLQTALKFYDQALKVLPDFPEAEYQRGTAFVQLGKINEAETAFRRALELRGDWTLPMANLGAVLVRQNKFPEAEKILLEAIKLDELNFPAYIALTELKLRSDASPKVLRSLLSQLQKITDSKAKTPAAVWAARASLERTLGDKTAARQSLNRAASLEPNNTNVLLERAELGLTENDFNGALADVQTLLKNSPNLLSAKLLMARIQTAGGNQTEALKTIENLSETEQKNPQTILVKDSILATMADGAEGVSSLEKLLEKDPKNAGILGRLCNLSRSVNPTKALDYCRRASELEPNNINHAVGYGAALVQARKFAEAAGLLRRILQIVPNNYTVRANLATALYELRQYKEAITEYNWLIESKPELAVAYYFKAIAHDNLGEYVEALAAYQKFLALADAEKNKLEIEKVNLRLPVLVRQVKNGDGRKGRKP
jgi:tetratricopeptide (TPR) repeat protein